MEGKETNHVTSTRNKGGGEREQRGITGRLWTLSTCRVSVNDEVCDKWMEHWWNNTDSWKMKYCEENLSHRYSAHHKSRMD
jgi:hypothetical protein